jgi:hypothetical protein
VVTGRPRVSMAVMTAIAVVVSLGSEFLEAAYAQASGRGCYRRPRPLRVRSRQPIASHSSHINGAPPPSPPLHW